MVRRGAVCGAAPTMSRRLSLRRRRAETAPGVEPDAPVASSAPEDGAADPAASSPTPAVTAVHATVASEEPSGATAAQARPVAGPPAGPSFRDRSRLRRRLRYLRRVRELGFRDLGGLVFDLHRFGREGSHLVAGKLGALAAVDRELRALEETLVDRRDFTVLREPGIAACPRCAALHGSDSNFCPNCGLRFEGPQAIAEVGDAPVTAPTGPLPAPPAPSETPAIRATAAGTAPISSGLGPPTADPPIADESGRAATRSDQPQTGPPAAEAEVDDLPGPVEPAVDGEQPTTSQPAVEPGRSSPAP